MAQASQSTPTVAANIGGVNHQVNLRDYLNIRVAPFVKKAITESLDASPEYPLQWLGENLIRQSMIYEGNPDSTQISERFLYKFADPVAASTATSPSNEQPAQPHTDAVTTSSSGDPVQVNNGAALDPAVVQDTPMSNHVNGSEEIAQPQQNDGPRDTEMTETSQD